MLSRTGRTRLPLLLTLCCGCLQDKAWEELLDPDRDGAPWPDDCRGDDPAILPYASEVCDGVDNDCDGKIDAEDPKLEGEGVVRFYADRDGDAAGDPDAPRDGCEGDRFAGYTSVGTDCDDDRSDVNPDASERCNDLDDDCDGGIDDLDPEGPEDPSTWYEDGDLDGFGDADAPSLACEAPMGAVSNDGDCDDTSPEISPDAPELCNDIDDDCDGGIDDLDPEGSEDPSAWYDDADDDGFGDPERGSSSCAAPASGVSAGTDCDDRDPSVNPGAVERCDDLDVDEDCDGTTDDLDTGDVLGETVWYADADADGHGDGGTTQTACDAPEGYDDDGLDCDDADAAVYPTAESLADDARVNDCTFWDPDEADGAVAERHALRPAGALTSAAASAILDGAVTLAQLGRAIATPDLDGDSLPDLAVGAPYYDADDASKDVGAVFAVFGPLSVGRASFLATPALSGAEESLRLASALAAVPDLDDDGLDELLIGTSGTVEEDGVAYLSLGPASALDVRLAASGQTYVGEALLVTDLADDGVVDLILSSHTAGKVWVVDGPTAVSSGDEVALGTSVFTGATGSSTGTAMASGDLDGDGSADLAVGAPSADAVYLLVDLEASASLVAADADALWRGEDNSDAGAALATLDADGDGDEDLVIGAPYADDYAGCATVYLSPLDGGTYADAESSLCGGVASGYLGDALVSPGDLDVDGYDDLAVGVRGSSAVHLLYGPLSAGSLGADAVLSGESSDDSFGGALGAGDLSGDGVPDLLIGAYLHDVDVDADGSDEDKVGQIWLLRAPGI